MTTSTTYDQVDMMDHFMTQGPFTYHLTKTTPAGTEVWGSLTGTIADYDTYAPVSLANTDFTAHPFTTATGVTSAANLSDITFPSPNTDAANGIVGFLIFDTSHNLRRFGTLSSALPAPLAHQPIVTPAGQLVISEG